MYSESIRYYLSFPTSFAVQPITEITGVNPTHKENDTVTVTCTIDRLYPQIQPANFTMRWGDTVREAVSEKNNDPDQSYRYGVQIIKTLTKEDNRMTVTCNVNPVRGTPRSEQTTLNVQCEYLSHYWV